MSQVGGELIYQPLSILTQFKVRCLSIRLCERNLSQGAEQLSDKSIDNQDRQAVDIRSLSQIKRRGSGSVNTPLG